MKPLLISICVLLGVLVFSVPAFEAAPPLPNSVLGNVLKSLFRSGGSSAKGGIVEPSAVDDLDDLDEGFDDKAESSNSIDLSDFLSPTKKSPTKWWQIRRDPPNIFNFFRRFTNRDRDVSSSSSMGSSSFWHDMPVIGRPIRVFSAFRQSASQGWRAFLKAAVPSLFSSV